MRTLMLLTAVLLLSPNLFPEEPPPRDLVGETLGRDIETAGYYELLAWCRQLELEDAGTRQALQGRLYDYYGIEAPSAAKEPSEAPKRILSIQSARSTEYFTVQEIDEDYVLLQGDVLVELQEKDAIHRIRAQRVLLNQTANLLTAEGDIEYTFKKGEREESFRGERITFDVDSWEGAFFSGGMEGDRDVAGKKVRFSFVADSIAKLESDTVVLDQGVITSCDEPQDPHYRIKARKIWVLAPGEWAIANAILYIGHIPVLYLPFFFHPGDEFFFHPALGYRDREGNFIQTTTYLIGQKRRSPSAISLLAATEESDRQYKREIQGLFLRQAEGEQTPVTETRFLKVFLDYYSRLGGFAGISGDFPPKASFRSGIGVSRTLYDNQGQYSPWDLDPRDPRYTSIWNQAWLFGLRLPFRYGIDSKWNLAGSGYRFSGKFEFYSDPFFASHFYNRAEETALTRLLGVEPQSGTSQTVEGEKLGLSWEASGQAEVQKPAWAPYLKKISIPYFSTNLYWQSRQNKQVESGYTDPQDTSLPEDPSRLFYYPVSLKLPNMAVQVSGELLSLPRREAAGSQVKPGGGPAPPAGLPPRELRLPSDVQPRSPAELLSAEPVREAEGLLLRKPNRREDLAVPPPLTPAAFILSYQVQPAMLVEQSFNSDGVDEPAEVRYDLNYTSLDSSGSTSLDWAFKVYDQLFSLNGSLVFSGNYRTHFRQSYSNEALWRELIHADNRYSQMLVRNLVNLSFFPFFTDPRFRSSSIVYSLNWTLFRYALDEDPPWVYGDPVYQEVPRLWDQNTVNQHQLQAVLGWQPTGGKTNTLSLFAQLPPFQQNIIAKAEAYIWLLKTTINGVFKENEDRLSVQETLEVGENVRLSEELQMNLRGTPDIIDASISSISLWDFSSSFTAQHQVLTGELEPATITAAYRLSQRDLYFWKNRARLELDMNSSWTMNLQNVQQNYLSFSLNLRFFLYKFMELSFTSTSYNNRTYLYFPSLAGPAYINPLLDLLRSFNFFSIEQQDRKNSAFKLKSIQVELVHHLHDWDLILKYEGKPVLTTDKLSNLPMYDWSDSFSVLLQWIPIPEMRSTIRREQDAFYIRG